MSDSESHEMDEEPIIYEEEEVLWAKIRGYPWWPAFVTLPSLRLTKSMAPILTPNTKSITQSSSSATTPSTVN
jgi:hypothetical protein